MGKVIDWSKAPEGATHIGVDQYGVYCWYRNIRSDYFEFCLLGDFMWSKTSGKPPAIEFFEPPAKPQWRGPQDGLPPVGMEVEFMWNYKPLDSEYVQVKILAHDSGNAIMRTLDGPEPGVLRENSGGYCGPKEGQPVFRLIRTPEQIAAEEREKAIKEMQASCAGLGAGAAIILYDAGYRKVEGGAK